MRLLLIHQGFPGQFKHIIAALQQRGDEITVISRFRRSDLIPNGLDYHSYTLSRGNGKDTHSLVLETESKVLRGEAVSKEAYKLREKGYTPDLILAHPGWGESLFLADIWPRVPQLHYVEFAYGVPGTDTDFPDKYLIEQTWEEKARKRMKNANVLLNLMTMSWGITPTNFQRSTIPSWAQCKTSVIHDGINTDWACPDSSEELILNNGLRLTAKDDVITFVNRTFEPYRGVHIFMGALPAVLNARPKAQAILVGHDSPNVSYGANRQDGCGWLTALRNELGDEIDWTRVHAIGTVPHYTLRQIFRISSAHVYFTYPFVLSWSLLEAMSCGALVIGSETAPVQEVIEHGFNGLLTPFADIEQLSHRIIETLSKPDEYLDLRKAARATIVKKYDLKNCLEQQISIIDAVAKGVIAA